MKEIKMVPFGKVLITGIEGFTGHYLSEYLTQAGYSVFGISFIESDPKKATHKCDIRQIWEVKKVIREVIPEYIIHLAGMSFVASENVQEMYTINLQGTLNLLDACLDLNIIPKKIILASSATVYGNQMSEVLSEDMCPIPNSHYANSKLAMENMARTYFEKLPIMIVRPFNYTGRGQALHFVIPKIVEHFREKKKVIELGNINVFREFNDIGYVTELYFKTMTIDYKSDVVNFCSGDAISLMEVIQTLNDLTGHRIDINIKSEYLRQNEISSLCGSVKKLENMLGILPEKISLSKTLSRMLWN